MRGISCFLAASLLWAASAREEGIAAFEAGRYSVALAKLTEAAKGFARYGRARLFLALTQAAIGDCRAALPGLTTADRLAGLAAAKCYAAIGDEGKAFARLEELRKQFPNDADVLYLRAKLHMKAFNDATLAMFQGAPASYRVHELSGEVLEVENRYSEAAGRISQGDRAECGGAGIALPVGKSDPARKPQSGSIAARGFRISRRIEAQSGRRGLRISVRADRAGRRQGRAKPNRISSARWPFRPALCRL